MSVDVHTHSTASDGLSRPSALVTEAVAAGLDVLALTDHDTFAGLDEARAAAEGTGLRVLAGIEISTRWAGMSVHLLGYGEALRGDPALLAAIADTVASREDRIVDMARAMAAGEAALDEDVLLRALTDNTPPGATPGRPHLADALVQLGFVGSRDEAFVRVLSESSPYYVPHRAPDTAKAVAMVAEAGGLAVLAHPRSAHGPGILSDAQIADIAIAGLSGLEVEHRDHDDVAKAGLRSLARTLKLFTTGSSDYHGLGKANRLGENVTTIEVFERMDASLDGRW